MKRTPTIAQIKRALKQRQKEVARARDRIRENIEELEALAESCDRAHEALVQAADALSELV